MNPYEILNISPTAKREDVRTAYRELARRWHPDRFMAGPERDWANEKMAQINAAYRMCLDGTVNKVMTAQAEDVSVAQARALVESGEYERARELLMSLNLRTAEWNYLFGMVLLGENHTQSALRYLSVAVHQKPEDKCYSAVYEKAVAAAEPKGPMSFLRKLRGKQNGGK